MDIKNKIKSFVNSRQGSKSLTELPVSEAFEADEALVIGKNDPPLKILNDPIVDQQILETIEDVYYNDDTFDSSLYELEKIPETPDKNAISGDKAQLTAQLRVVSRKLSELILQNQTPLAEELQRVTDLQKSLEEAVAICLSSRSLLKKTKQNFTVASLGILASYRKREQLKSLLKSLFLIKTLQETDIRLRELLEEEDYPGAIQLCLECQKAASTFKHYKCISELSCKLQDTLVMTEEQLDVALSKVCISFNKVHYEKLQAAYTLLGKTQTAIDQLLMHFASAIHNKAFTIVLSYVESNESEVDKNILKSLYSDLCKHITSENFTPCLVDLCKALWDIVYSYWCILDWHESSDKSNSHFEDEKNVEKIPVEEVTFHNESYVKQKLEHGLLRVWQDVQQKVKAYLLAADISSFKFNEFIYILAVTQKLMDIGEDFCGSHSDDLQSSLRKQSVNYFHSYHSGFMEELRAFLENESWELCPVHSAFSAIHLQEFTFLKQQKEQFLGNNKFQSPCRNENFFKKYDSANNPFNEKVEAEATEDILAVKVDEEIDGVGYESDSDDSDVAEELKKDYIDENTGENIPSEINFRMKKKPITISRKKVIPILTNTALSVLRSFGKYMQMMSVLKPIAFDVLICMTQLFDYYMYSVYLFFAKEMCDLSDNILSNRLRTTLKRIREDIVNEDNKFDTRNKYMVPPPKLSSLVAIKNIENLYGLAERVVAAESLAFLAGQFQLLQPYLEALIPSSKIAFLQQFCSQTISQASDLRQPVYMTVAARCVDYEQIVNLMSVVKWDIHEIMSQHSSYVDILLRELQIFSMRLSEVSKKVPIPKEANDLLWEHCIKLANYSFIEGFSQAKKCTNGGRALMQLDYQQFLCKVESLTDLRPIPEKDQVEYYIKAYYYLESNLEQFIRTRKEYTSKQLIGLINCITQLSKKGRQRLLNLIEESDRLKR